jgi:hypothetical protein
MNLSQIPGTSLGILAKYEPRSPDFPTGGVGCTRSLAPEAMVDAWWLLLSAAIPGSHGRLGHPHQVALQRGAAPQGGTWAGEERI